MEALLGGSLKGSGWLLYDFEAEEDHAVGGGGWEREGLGLSEGLKELPIDEIGAGFQMSLSKKVCGIESQNSVGEL